MISINILNENLNRLLTTSSGEETDIDRDPKGQSMVPNDIVGQKRVDDSNGKKKKRRFGGPIPECP